MKPFILTPRAAQDVGDIWDYIAGDSIEAADRVLEALEKAMYRLSKSPGIGHVREELADRRHRFFLIYSYLGGAVKRTSASPRAVKISQATSRILKQRMKAADEGRLLSAEEARLRIRRWFAKPTGPAELA